MCLIGRFNLSIKVLSCTCIVLSVYNLIVLLGYILPFRLYGLLYETN